MAIDGLYEIDLEANRQRSFIGDSTLLNWNPDDGYQLLFTLKDRLGSATTLANHDGQVISRRYFDPFGKTSSAFDNTTTDIKVGLNTEANANSTHANSTHANNTFTDLNKNNHYRRGFTGHEHLNEQQLIHMNGRLYDYNLSRFLSVDPFIFAPKNTQTINPYSYIMNNPLAETDPTGYNPAIDNRAANFGIAVNTTLGIWSEEQANVVAQGEGEAFSNTEAASAVEAGILAKAAVATGAIVGAAYVARSLSEKVTNTRQASKKSKTAQTSQKNEGHSNAKNTSKGNGSKPESTTDIGSQSKNNKNYHTYTKTNPKTSEVYTGRASGKGSPQENIEKRDSNNHHMNDKNGGAKSQGGF